MILGLKGDASDNIPGVKGVGEKTALTLLADFQTLENIYEHIENIKSKSVVKKLSTAKEMAYLSKKLVTIDCYAPVDVTIDQFEFKPDWLKVQQTCLKIMNLSV